MWFFKKDSGLEHPEESIPVEQLMPFLNKSFESAILEFSKMSEEHVSLFDSSKKEFITACHILEQYKGEPVVEDMWAPNINSIKLQKISYTKTLERIILHEREGSFTTSYGKYKAELSYMEELISELLRVNNMFKVVIMSYSNELSQFKKVFSNMERARDKLRLGLTTIEPQHRSYEELMNKIENLQGMLDEYELMQQNSAALSKEISSLENTNSSSINDELSNYSNEIKLKLSSFDNESSQLKLKLSSVLIPIERAARKMDYSYSSEGSLSCSSALRKIYAEVLSWLSLA